MLPLRWSKPEKEPGAVKKRGRQGRRPERQKEEAEEDGGVLVTVIKSNGVENQGGGAVGGQAAAHFAPLSSPHQHFTPPQPP